MPDTLNSRSKGRRPPLKALRVCRELIVNTHIEPEKRLVLPDIRMVFKEHIQGIDKLEEVIRVGKGNEDCRFVADNISIADSQCRVRLIVVLILKKVD